MSCEIFTEYFCMQCQKLVEDPCAHFDVYPDHALNTLTTASGLYDLVLYQPGYAEKLVAPISGTSTKVISGFYTIEEAINYLVTSGVDAGMPTQAISGFDTIEDAINAIVNSGISFINHDGTPTTTLDGYETLEGAIEDLQVGVDSGKIRNYSYSDEGSKVGLVNSSSHYKTVQVVIFEGSSTLGLPTEIKAAIKRKSSGTAGIRIVDVTNNKIVCTKTGFTNSSYTIQDLGSLSNISTTEVVWEIQLKKAYCAALSIKF